MMSGASGDECVNLLGGKNTIGRTAAVFKKPHKATFTFFTFHIYLFYLFFVLSVVESN